MARAFNTIQVTRNSKINIKLNRSGFEELDMAINRVLSVRKVKRTNVDLAIQAVLMAELRMLILKRGLIIRDEYSLSWTIAQAITFFVWTNPDEELMETCPNLRILNQNIHQQLI